MIKIVELQQTCHACPSQWSGKTIDGEEVYIRYRWGYLNIAVNNEPIYYEFHGDEEPDLSLDEEIKKCKQWGCDDEAAKKMAASNILIRKFTIEHGGKMSYSGTMSYETLKELTEHLIEWSLNEAPHTLTDDWQIT